MKAQTLAIALSLFTVQIIVAQSPLSVLENRLCKTWKLDRTVQGDKTSSTDQALSDFVMILNPDHTAKQGMAPDGLIGGKWTVDEKTMTLIIKDDVTSQEYKMKISSLTTDELVLQDPSGNPASYIHYRAK
ncbi:MAG TPA: hypothetical protein VE978_25955 [Chitinophagales bacterium]|nr:hypothetical protein [Chitinophagales bacterium]